MTTGSMNTPSLDRLKKTSFQRASKSTRPGSILISDEYEGAMRDIMALSEGYYGIDYRVLDIRQDTLGGKPALTMEYVIVDLVDPDLPALKAIETITTGWHRDVLNFIWRRA